MDHKIFFCHGQVRRKIDAVMVFPTPIFWLEKINEFLATRIHNVLDFSISVKYKFDN